MLSWEIFLNNIHAKRAGFSALFTILSKLSDRASTLISSKVSGWVRLSFWAWSMRRGELLDCKAGRRLERDRGGLNELGFGVYDLFGDDRKLDYFYQGSSRGGPG